MRPFSRACVPTYEKNPQTIDVEILIACIATHVQYLPLGGVEREDANLGVWQRSESAADRCWSQERAPPFKVSSASLVIFDGRDSQKNRLPLTVVHSIHHRGIGVSLKPGALLSRRRKTKG